MHLTTAVDTWYKQVVPLLVISPNRISRNLCTSFDLLSFNIQWTNPSPSQSNSFQTNLMLYIVSHCGKFHFVTSCQINGLVLWISYVANQKPTAFFQTPRGRIETSSTSSVWSALSYLQNSWRQHVEVHRTLNWMVIVIIDNNCVGLKYNHPRKYQKKWHLHFKNDLAIEICGYTILEMYSKMVIDSSCISSKRSSTMPCKSHLPDLKISY